MSARKPFQRGAALVEFAFIVILLLTIILGILEAGRALYQWNSAVDATRIGARTAAIAAMNDRTTIENAMRLDLTGLQDATVSIAYSADGSFTDTCAGRGTCMFVRVGVTYTFNSQVFVLPWEIQMPTFYTTLPVEALGAT